MMMSTTAIDYERVRHFAGKVMGDLAGLSASLLAIIGDRLGLFRALDEGGPATSEQLAARTGVAERYVREWLYGLHAAGCLELDRERRSFSLPPEHAEVLAREGAPFFLAGSAQVWWGGLAVLDPLTEAFHSGGGVPQAAYPDDMTEALRRNSAPWFEHQLLGQWIPAADDLRAKLEAGVRYADVGCGAGHAVQAGQPIPPLDVRRLRRVRRRDRSSPTRSPARAARRARAVRIPERYDVISTFTSCTRSVSKPGDVLARETLIPRHGFRTQNVPTRDARSASVSCTEAESGGWRTT
jgi:hypothetical protein